MPQARIAYVFLLVVLAPLWASAQESKSSSGRLSQAEFWKSVKRQLTSAGADDYFEHGFKSAYVPGGAGGLRTLTGALLSADPPDRPSVLIVALSDQSTPDAKLVLKDANWNDTHLSGPLVRGSLITFEGVPVSFTKDPFVVTFAVSTARRSTLYFSGPAKQK